MFLAVSTLMLFHIVSVSRLGRLEYYAVVWRHVFVEIYWRFRVVCCQYSRNRFVWKLRQICSHIHGVTSQKIASPSWIILTLPFPVVQEFCCKHPRRTASVWAEAKETGFIIESLWSLWGMGWGQRNRFYNWDSLWSVRYELRPKKQVL